MFDRVKGFGIAHVTDFSSSGLAPGLFADLTTIVTQLENYASAEVSGKGTAKQGGSIRAAARKALRADLEAIYRTARAISLDIPGFKEGFRVPRGNNDEHLLQTARAFASDAAPFSVQFIAHEMPADFLEELNADIANMQAAISHQSSGIGDHIEAGVAIDETINAGLAIVRKLDAIVRNRYANDPGTVAEWTSASHTERSPRRRKPSPPTSLSAELSGDTPQ